MKSLTIFATGAISALVLGSGVAVAATGGSFILGRANTAGTTTALTNNNGTALSLGSKAGTPSLKVNSTALVAKLNADRVDGKNATDFASSKARTGYISAAGEWTDLDDDGQADAILAVAQCPTGSVLTGGGFNDYTSTGTIFDNSPLGQNAWFAAVVADPTEDPADVQSYAICMNLRGGTIAGSTPTLRTNGIDGLAAKHRVKGQ